MALEGYKLFLFCGLMLLLRAQAQTPADSIVNPDIFLKTSPEAPPSEMQKAYDNLRMRNTYEHDKEDPRRQTGCV